METNSIATGVVGALVQSASTVFGSRMLARSLRPTEGPKQEDMCLSSPDADGPVMSVDSGVGPWAKWYARARYSPAKGLS